MDQTGLIHFLNLAVDGPTEFEIELEEPAKQVVIRPHSLGIVPAVKGSRVHFTLEKPAHFTVEPYGRHHALHIFADPMPQYNIGPADETVLYYAPVSSPWNCWPTRIFLFRRKTWPDPGCSF